MLSKESTFVVSLCLVRHANGVALSCFSGFGGSRCTSWSVGLEPSHDLTLTLTPSTSEVSISPPPRCMCDPHGDMSLEAAQTGVYVPLASELPTSEQCHGYWVRINLRASESPPRRMGAATLSRMGSMLISTIEQDGRYLRSENGTFLPPPEARSGLELPAAAPAFGSRS